MTGEDAIQERQYGTRKIRYIGLIDHLEKNATLVESYKNGDHIKSIYHYNNSTVVVKLEQTKLRLRIVSNTRDQSSIVLGELEKILLLRKKID